MIDDMGADEDAFVMPDAWWRARHPRRDRPDVPPATAPDEAAVERPRSWTPSASGTLTLDYGPRRFVIGFDEMLRPTVADEGGPGRKSLPKPGAKDAPELARAAHKQFAGLRKDVRTVAADQLARFESAMVTGRRWPVARRAFHAFD
ncbi:DUF4132 domain-containing protein [Actinomadura xylanilytica]|uniref:DUF4132 domain-containing protein n=1 Tax=Actinomadura xylanilytica TaxID=887459 RepID=UPI00255AD493|nr:DUF4132 domain-containing protein [Actinomadura xylanilytica]MDL4776417.1 DUF4132 domain-containing protein [Actinomadura xylanilytica]